MNVALCFDLLSAAQHATATLVKTLSSHSPSLVILSTPLGTQHFKRGFADFVRDKPHVNIGTIGHVDHGEFAIHSQLKQHQIQTATIESVIEFAQSIQQLTMSSAPMRRCTISLFTQLQAKPL